MSGRNCLLTCFPQMIPMHPLLVALIWFLQISYAKMNQHCSSSCGDIQNISHPFRLQNDPQGCGDQSYELVCEHNTTLLYLDSHKYYVRAINYHNYTIHLVDASIIPSDVCSFPNYTVSVADNSQYSTLTYNPADKPDMVTPITSLSCPNRLNSSLLVQTDICLNRSYAVNAPSQTRHLYIKVGQLLARDLEEMCKLNVVAMTSMPFRNPDRVSLAEIHASLLYGFELSWFSVVCPKCRGRALCLFDGETCTVITCSKLKKNSFTCKLEMSSLEMVLMIVAIAAVALKGLGIPSCLIGLGLAVRIVIGLPGLLVILIYRYRMRHLSKFHDIEGFLQNRSNLMPVRYSYSDIKRITRGFQQKLGQGGFGSVYKGKLHSGHDVAVKILNDSKSDGQDFINEVATIGRIHHTNVVALVGYCAEKSRCALVYDFMPNGSLDKYISSHERFKSLSWQRKHEIAVGVAKGIDYLHQGCDVKILHFDIKPHNILLDSEFNPKVSDFGLAKLYSRKNSTMALTGARGTFGYVAPELINRSIGGISNKVDVYSFGMLLIDMLGLKGNSAVDSDNCTQYFPNWIYDHFHKGKEIVGDGNGSEETDDHVRDVKRKMTIVALWCIQLAPVDRPSMREVVAMLEGEGGDLEIPAQGCSTSQIVKNEDQSLGTYSSDSTALLGNSGL